MQNYEYVSTIGEGAYGEVWKCRDKSTGDLVAVKGFKQAHQDKVILNLAVREAKLLSLIKHPNLVKLHAAFRSRSGKVYLVFEYVNSSVHDHLERYPCGLPSIPTKILSWQLLSGAAYLHDNKILHRDIKPANILISSQGVVKLCDLGFARGTTCGLREILPLTAYITTRWYRAPEVLIGGHYGPSADWAPDSRRVEPSGQLAVHCSRD
ncbi:hypothetical protein VOLCADRAFT_88899 [Volvox carteri f. nagariensis]|uniref:cyclin-dependent kinase n=1 Tax=Volvox carteri f. nagariensis TaxID=3068 RepID=D8TQ90_VOLCA|nr:uncharacterized protein VOLCADRAFT_88899 [Volvox carteri f. nagariensis]EFJ50492.1 hypothetical protein VOLCADRAFT_88899 [Volvox carteri f. nagariensis]|eukprot:XP_002948617.1 hypothetical protein VOLCADRAFT_88899 [Volvox carteri f. nagariensis]